MVDPNQSLIEVDKHLEGWLLEDTESELQARVIDLLRVASAVPGRAAKLHVIYLMERLAELVKDLTDKNDNVVANEEGFLRWIDRGLVYAAYLTNPDSQGRWLESFDQTLLKAKILNMKDPEAAKQRQKEAAELSRKWQEAMASTPREGNQIVEPKRSSGNMIILPR